MKTFALGTAASSLFGKVWQASVLADVTPSNVGKLKVKLSDYPALQQDNGSVRLGVNTIDNPVGPNGDFYPILVNRVSSTTFHAVNTRCPHAGCIVAPFDDTENACVCPCHGSRFSINGEFLTGPAGASLTTYPVTLDGNDTLTIEVPDLGYCVDTALVTTNNNAPRLKLSFPSLFDVEYEVLFRQNVTAPWTAVPFAISLNGAVDQLSIVGDGAVKSLYVNRTASVGFYSVAIRVLDLTEG